MARVGFVLYFGDLKAVFADLSILSKAFLLGLRYDLIPIAYINIIPFLLMSFAYYLPGQLVATKTRHFIVSFLCVGYTILILLTVFDYGFYSYFQDHFNILAFGLFEDDTKAVLISIWKNYNLPLWLSVIACILYLFYTFIKFIFSPYEFDLSVKKNDLRIFPVLILGSIILAYFGRGTFNRLPLSIEDAHISSNTFVNKLSLNAVLTLNRAFRIRKMFGGSQYDYLQNYKYNNWQEAYADAFSKKASQENLILNLTHKTSIQPKLEKNPPHVVLVVMESFGSYWNDQNSETFNILGDLKEEFNNGLLFKNFLSSENGTIGSIVAVATSQVTRPGARYLSESEFMNTTLSSSGNLAYKNAGYETHFVYGGKLGWRDLGRFLGNQKYDHLWGADEIKEKMPELTNLPERDQGNEWGIFDEYLFSFVENHIKNSNKPQFILVLTTSNHPPFEHPTTFKPRPINFIPAIFEKIAAEEDFAKKRFVSLQYSNQKTAEFIKRTRSQVLKNNTVIALTGDHSYWIARGVGDDEEFKRYAVPFFISLPKDLMPKNPNLKKFGSHEDIFPTLFHLTLSNQNYIKLGEDMLGEESYSINNAEIVAGTQGAYHHSRYWKWKDFEKQILEETNETPELLKLKKHYEGLISITDLYLKAEKKKPSKN